MCQQKLLMEQSVNSTHSKSSNNNHLEDYTCSNVLHFTQVAEKWPYLFQHKNNSKRRQLLKIATTYIAITATVILEFLEDKQKSNIRG